jgi:outer membrane protein assembly factor BamB
MRRHSARAILPAACAMAFVAGLAWAQDWPQWRGPDRDGRVASFAVPAVWPRELAQVWRASVGYGDSTPALVGERLYVFTRQGASEITRCLDASTGRELWKDGYAAPAVSGAAASHPGPRSSPAVAEGMVVTLGVGGVLSCLDAASGRVLWRKSDFPGGVPQFFAGSSPLVASGVCIAQVGGRGGGIAAFAMDSGAEKWRWDGDGPAYASPVLMSAGGLEMVLAQTDRYVVALAAATGRSLWQAPFQVTGIAFNAVTPIVDGQVMVYAGQGRGARAVRFERSGDGVSATEIWSNTENPVQFDTPVLKGGRLYGLSQAGRFFCVDASTGRTLWTDPTGMRGAFGGIVDAGSALVGLTAQGYLVVFEPSDKAYTELAKYKVAATETYAHPVLSGNRIFVKDQESVTLWTVR